MAIRTIAPPSTDDSPRARETGTSNLPTPAPSPQPTHDQIAERAYGRFEARGRADGLDLQDWLDAERELEDSLSESE
jgi:hypothetical protein